MILHSLQGLGNSIINYPILVALRATRPVRVVAFENGSADFFRAFHDDVMGVRTNADLLRLARQTRADEVFTCAPTWRRELAAHCLTRSQVKQVRAAAGLGSLLTWGAPSARGDVHDLENNLELLGWSEPRAPSLAPEVPDLKPDGARRLGVHPTASTELKYYGLPFWREMLNGLQNDFDEVHVFCGSDAREIEYARALGGDHLHAGLGFGPLTERLAGLNTFVGTDSALMHLSAQLGRPTVGLWSYADYRRIHPYGDAAAVYVPRETVVAKDFRRPAVRPSYLDRARAADVIEIVRGRRTADRQLARRFGPPVALHEY